MNKAQFIAALRQRLSHLPPAEVEPSIRFYAESIDDRIEDGMSEAEAVAAVGDVESVARAIELELPLSTIVRQRVRDGRERSGGTKALWIILAIIGFPVWLPLLLTALALILAVYVVVWAVIVSLFAALLALLVTGLFLIAYGFLRLLRLGFFGMFMAVGAGLACAGLGLLLAWPISLLAKALARLTASFGRWIKGLFLNRKGDAV